MKIKIFLSHIRDKNKFKNRDSLFPLVQCFKQRSQNHTEGCIGLASGTIYFGYRSIPVYHFEFTAIFYIYQYIYIYIYVCMYVCMCVCINKYKILS